MSARFHPVTWQFAALLLMAVATVGMAEAPPRNNAPVKFTPEMIQQASVADPPSRDSPYRLRKEDPMHDIFRDAPKNLEHIPNGCTQNSGSLCFDYRAGNTVYKPMRKLLPDIPGMTPHNLSVRRNKIVAQYTFK